jgi:large subunit ribosomal protein L27e
VIVKQTDEATKKGRKFPHCVVAGIERYPRKVTRRMGQKKLARRCRIKPFVKHLNYAHVMPTRYVLGPDMDLKNIVTDDALAKPESRKTMNMSIKKLFEERYTAPPTTKDEKAISAEYFFKKLKF